MPDTKFSLSGILFIFDSPWEDAASVLRMWFPSMFPTHTLHSPQPPPVAKPFLRLGVRTPSSDKGSLSSRPGSCLGHTGNKEGRLSSALPSQKWVQRRLPGEGLC